MDESHKNMKLNEKSPVVPQTYTKVYWELVKAGNMKGGFVILDGSHSDWSKKKSQRRFSLYLSEG